MNIDDLNGTQLYIAGSILSKIAESMMAQDSSSMDDDTSKAFKYILSKLDDLNKDVAAKILSQILNNMKNMMEVFNEENRL